MEVIRINGALVNTAHEIEAFISLGNTNTVQIYSKKPIGNIEYVELLSFKNGIFIGGLTFVEEKDYGYFYSKKFIYRFLNDYRETKKEVPSFTCRSCDKEYEGKPNFQMKAVKDGDKHSKFFCDSCWVNFDQDSLYFGNLLRIPLDKDRIETVKVVKCYRCSKVIKGDPEFRGVSENVSICSIDCALRKEAEGLVVYKYQKLKGK